jgi:hypothetical protein
MIGLFAKAMVAILLSITIVYCFLLDRRLRRRRADEQPVGDASAAAATAMEIADGAIAVRVVKPLRRPRPAVAKFDAAQGRSRGMESP